MSWPEVQLRRVARFAYGDSLADAERIEGAVPVYGSNGQVGQHNRANTGGPAIVIGRKGSFGKLQFSTNPVFAIDTTFFVDATRTDADLRWLYYALGTLRLDQLSEDVGVPGLSREKAYSQRLPLPPRDEQRAIADYLDRETARIDALIAARKRMMALLTERRASTIAAHVMPSMDQSPGWRLMRLRHLVRRIVDTEHKTTPFYDDGEFLVVRTSNVKAGRLLVGPDSKFTDAVGYREWTVRGIPEAGDVLFTREAPAGEACLMPPNMRACIGQRMVLIKLDETIISGRYALRALYGGIARSFIDELSQGSTVSHFNMRDISDVPLWVPPLEQQYEIASRLDRATARLDRLAEAIEEQMRLLSEHRSALITAAVTGDVAVPVAA